ncbi:Propanediol dehydratase medium subunit [Pelotomaculum schinkii]|uniref:Propanediol dehydratase medium subunit n=1 Tax=Pelotomaculum schinkii TaxID=78350 RepID=A0A4Y7RHS3_9FIRM|nr:glycerol dehydratase reactivase beta/small subunit family protein [Pelotomaculum schinkii]TEB08534.1 Propanediol dehydratase medium subunit [Pelotomaculum schinkii]
MARGLVLENIGPAKPGIKNEEIVIAVSAAFGIDIFQTLSGLSLGDVLFEIIAGAEEQGVDTRIVRFSRTADLAFIGHDGAKLSGSGISVGIQSKGTTVIHQKDLYPLSNLELFSMAPFIGLEHYRAIGRNAARYAIGLEPELIVAPWSKLDAHTVKARTLPLAALIHQIEERRCSKNSIPMELDVKF